MFLFCLELIIPLWSYDPSRLERAPENVSVDFWVSVVLLNLAGPVQGIYIGRSIRLACSLGNPEENKESILPRTQSLAAVDEKK